MSKREQEMPWNEDAERVIIGLMIIESALIIPQTNPLAPSDFALDSHRRIFRCLREMHERGAVIDYMTLKTELAKRRELETVGGLAYLQDLGVLLPKRTTISQFVHEVKQKAALRTIIHACTGAIAQAKELGTAPEDCIGNLEKAIRSASQWRPEPSTESGFFVGALTFANSIPEEFDWAVENLIPRGWGGMIIAEPKSLKSFSALDLLINLSLGLPWLGFKVPKRMKTAILAREDYPGLTAWRVKHFLRGKLDDYPKLTEEVAAFDEWMYINSRAQTATFTLTNPEDLRTLIANLKARKVEFLVMDVFRRLHNADENDSGEMQQVLNQVIRIQNEVGCAVGIVHHVNKAEGPLFFRTRGSSALHGFMEWGVGLSTVNQDAPPRNWVRKMEFLTKAGREPDPIYIRSRECGNWIKLEVTEYEEEKPKKGSKAASYING
jgi:hypothetical protein